MSSQQSFERGSESVQGTPVGASVPFDSINSAGAYVAEWSGHLFRVPNDSIQAGRSPLMAVEAIEPLRVRKISNDPFIARTKAAMICAKHDLAQNFA